MIDQKKLIKLIELVNDNSEQIFNIQKDIIQIIKQLVNDQRKLKTEINFLKLQIKNSK